MSGHGGARPGAGRKRQYDYAQLLQLRAAGLTIRQIAERLSRSERGVATAIHKARKACAC